MTLLVFKPAVAIRTLLLRLFSFGNAFLGHGNEVVVKCELVVNW